MKPNYLEISGRTYYGFEEPDFIGPVPIRPRAAPALSVLENYKAFEEMTVWERQIAGHKFDWFFGVIMPVVCFFFDPIVFSSQLASEKPVLGGIKTFAFVLSFISIIGLMASLLFGEKLKGLNAVLSGLFATAAGFSVLVAIFIVPFSLLGLMLIIGILGFTPWFTSFVYFRRAVRSFHAAEPFMERGFLLQTMMLAAIASVVIPYLLNFW